MSPRRMDISSLLRDPEPDPLTPRDKPRSIDALLHPSPPRQPFLGLDALVHVASEEHRRIASAAPPSRHPFLHHGAPHPRPPRSPSPDPRFAPPSTSPSTRLHPSASPFNIYPTLQRQPVLHMEPIRTAPALPLADPRAIPHPSLQDTSLFLHARHPPHSSPRNTSPLRHSPHQFHSHHHPSPTHAGPASTGGDAMSPRYGHGPRMAGGIEILLSSNPSPTRDTPRPAVSNFPSPGRDLSAERFVPRTEHPRYEPSTPSPFSVRPSSFEDDRRLPPHHVESRESDLFARSRPPYLPLVDAATDNVHIHAKAVDARPQPDRHPIRVWEGQPTRVSPAHLHDILCTPAVSPPWLARSGHGILPTKGDQVPDVSMLPTSVSEELPSPTVPSDVHIPHERNPLGTRPPSPMVIQPRSPDPQAHSLNAACPSPPIPPVPASPVLDLHATNPETRAETSAEASQPHPLTPPDPIVTKSIIGNAKPTLGDVDDILMANPLPRQPSPGPVQAVLAEESGGFGMASHPTLADTSQTTSRSPTQPPSLLPSRDETMSDTPDVLISASIKPKSPHRSPQRTDTSEQEPLIPEQSMMDVDEELLSLVEDRPVCVIPTVPAVQVESTLPSPSTAGRGTSTGTEQGSSRNADGPPSVLPSLSIFKGPLDKEKDRASMPPPTARNKKAEKDKTAGSKKKKDGTSKPAAKAKQPSKPRAKPAVKSKAKTNIVDASLKCIIPKNTVNLNERSRSTSVIPAAVDDIAPEPDADDSDKEDDKLYCVCKTRYNEDRMMIACDRCDEWFHTLCVNMPDLEIDLVDQFICPPCIQKQPHLRTTWKRRCLWGLQHANPSASEACHKPSRGAFSKYCSDECGIRYMQARIVQWEKTGGVRELLWESVKNAPKREGVVRGAQTNGTSPGKMDVDVNNSEFSPPDSAAKRRAEREVARLNARLDDVVKQREFMKRELDVVTWREKVVDLASKRAIKVDECGWDQRLCFGEEEWADFGQEVLDSYEEERVKGESGDDPMPLDATSAMHGEWWCAGKRKCERHVGWQKLRAAEVSFDKETKEGVLLKLTTREREIRKRIEDIFYPQPTGTLQVPCEADQPEVQMNGSEKTLPASHVPQRGKKKSS